MMVKISKETYLTFDDVLLKPKFSRIETRQNIDLSTTFGPIDLKLPIMSANMDYVTEFYMAKAMWNAGGFYALHRFYREEKDLEHDIGQLAYNGMPISISLGIRNLDAEIERLSIAKYYGSLLQRPIIVFIDVAHGHHQKVGDFIPLIKDIAPEAFVVAGNVATSTGFSYLYDAGADAVKVGIGPGAVCTTRSVAGVGVPQFSAIVEVCEERDKKLRYLPIIADGGFRTSGDMVKALAAGADLIMLGYLLAGSEETPAPTVPLGDKQYKAYRGQSTIGVNLSRETPEGVEGFVPLSGEASKTINRLAAGLRSGLSYVGAENLAILRLKAEFVTVSPHTIVENQTRVVLG